MSPQSSSKSKTVKTRKKSAPRRRAPRRTCVLVLGMHRSGTSMLTGILNQLGCVIPERLLPANFANERGYFESWAVCKLNDEILRAAGSAWDDWAPIPADWFETAEALEFRAQAAALIDKEYGQSPLLALKDPRVCRLLPLWRGALADTGIEPVVIHIHRHPLEVAASLLARDGIPTDYGQLLWLRNVLEAEAASRDLPRCFIAYPDLIENWRTVLDQVGATLGLSWPNAPEAAATGIESFISPGLRHYRHPPEAALENPGLPDWFRDTFAILQTWTTGTPKTGDQARLDDIRHDLDRTIPVFARLLNDGRETVRRLAERDTLLRRLECRRADAAALNQQLIEQTSDLQNRLNEVQKAAARHRAHADALQAHLETERSKAEALHYEKAQIYTSTSWRMMAPLRWVARAIWR